MQLKFESNYARIAARVAPATPPTSQTDYVDRFMANYVALYQRRSAIALNDIGTPEARQELRDALASDTPYRTSVLRTIWAGLPFEGTLSATTVSFLDTVVVRAGSAIGWDGDESVVLEGTPFAADLFTRRWGNDSLAFVVAADTGTYRLSIVDQGPSQLVQDTIIHVTSFSYTPNTLVGATDFTVRPFPQILYSALTEPDTADYYRLEPSVPMNVTAVLDWSTTTADLDLWWSDCGLIPENGSVLEKPERADVHLPASECRLLGIYLVSGPQPKPIIIQLRLTSP